MNQHHAKSLNPAITVLTDEVRKDLEDELERDIRAAEARIQQLESKDSGLTALYGSSSIRLWDTMKRDLSTLSVVNLGFGGASYDYALAYFDRIFKDITPEHVVLYFGDNDIARGQTPEQILGNLRELLSRLETRYPGVRISTISVKPSPIRTPLMHLAREVNELIKAEMTLSPRRHYIDIVTHFLDADGLPEKRYYLDDMLHFNEMGYRNWGDRLHDALAPDAPVA